MFKYTGTPETGKQRAHSSSVGCGSAVKIQPLPSQNNHILDYNQGDYVEQNDTRLYEEQILSVIDSGVNCRISIFVHSKFLLFCKLKQTDIFPEHRT